MPASPTSARSASSSGRLTQPSRGCAACRSRRPRPRRRRRPAASGAASMPSPTPHGVPVITTSPGSSVKRVRAERQQLGDAEDHVRRAGVLERLAVDARAQPERLRVGDLVGCDDDRAERAERVEALAAHPLPVGELHVTRGDVVDDGVAEDVVERVGGGDTSRIVRPTTTASSTSQSTRSLIARSISIASPSPMMLVVNFVKTSGRSGGVDAGLAYVRRGSSGRSRRSCPGAAASSAARRRAAPRRWERSGPLQP